MGNPLTIIRSDRFGNAEIDTIQADQCFSYPNRLFFISRRFENNISGSMRYTLATGKKYRFVVCPEGVEYKIWRGFFTH